MGLIDSISATNDKASDAGERYLKTSYKYYKLKIFQQLSISVSMVFKALIIGSLVIMFILLLAISLALFIGETINNYPLGFLIVSIIFLVLSVIAYYLKGEVDKRIIKELSKKFFN
ncbi:MAG: hypothetical protein WA839_06370 [Flavobacteriaceae bacterium]|tara:strand:- start:3743 stop:4090 length:348 start_codon:yes stop_codon:yes gene_type:complete